MLATSANALNPFQAKVHAQALAIARNSDLDIDPFDASYTAIALDLTKAFILVRIRDITEFLVPATARLPSRNHDTGVVPHEPKTF